jgi:hypothetical protein
MSEEKNITITVAEYERLQAADELLGQVFSDCPGELDSYIECYPDLVKAAGHWDGEDEDDEDDAA